MKSKTRIVLLTLAVAAAGTAMIAGPALQNRAADGQTTVSDSQTTNPAGSPGAVTIDGRYLPPPPQPFAGQIAPNASQSTPSWPMRVVPPKGAPNILLVMTDDVGFAAPSTFGSVIPTPAMDRIEEDRLTYTRFHH